MSLHLGIAAEAVAAGKLPVLHVAEGLFYLKVGHTICNLEELLFEYLGVPLGTKAAQNGGLCDRFRITRSL